MNNFDIVYPANSDDNKVGGEDLGTAYQPGDGYGFPTLGSRQAFLV